MIKIKDIAFTGYPVTDLAKARHFYENILGLTAKVYSEEEACSTGDEKGWIEYELPSGTFAITNVAPDWKPSTSGPSIALEVADINSALQDLKKNDVPIALEPFESPVCFFAVILDPDKNSVILHQRKTTHPDYTD
ncbi:hypothetical protein MNBD_NITROSPIRAE01-1262 [hydrothermal vent metagenome]|uniref:VOC domain-containing protein n=1 Tax=hydrothermal vent metagenome TaxID=652676 RepID=A0A3B1CZ02_9ZZZZ